MAAATDRSKTSWDPIWESVFANQAWGRYPAESLIRFIARNYYARKRDSVRILEIGCGAGANVWYMAREGFDVYGIDGSRTAINYAQERMRREGVAADLRVGDIVSLPYDSEMFDAVIDVECLYSNSEKNAQKIMTEVSRVLRKDGMLYSRTFADDMYLGKSHTRLGGLEYDNISDGPLAGKGLVRLADKDSLQKIYGGIFNIVSTDKMTHTIDNGSVRVCEWVIVCRRKDR